ncbi:AraC family transcriptional regulator [Pasteurella caecimuris]|uniref:AraC family transcriptional regulator n=1 Tax=Rodentibacter caecimuris TaxID=1796644 RepID=UPI00214FB267|nr:AraC family transcriptional regulator [Pasteurella caecimuris]MCR1838039.1 AraC family transcriptional regulator [Pasteurella caecimuris]MCU0107153.1 AraC family transcriptional regulator [Pasteurella caecimuris]
MDILDKLIKFAQISGSINVQCKLQDSWYIRHERQTCHGIVHIVSQGEGYLHIDGMVNAIKLKANDVVFIPHSLGHVLTHQPNYKGPSKINIISNGAFTLKQCGGESPDFSLFCANFTYDKQSELFNNLPEVILLNLQDAALLPLLDILQREADEYQAGSANIINALLSVLLTLLIRAYLQQDNAQPNGLRDKRLYNVISNIIAKPEQGWKIETLCHIANLSKAQLIRLFNRQLGVSPYNFVNHIRLQKAAELLKHSQQSVLSIALNCGFQSESNFGKAFKKYYQLTPGQYRKK